MKLKTNPDPLYQLIVTDTPLGTIHCSASSLGVVSLAFYAEPVELLPIVDVPEGFRKLKDEIIAYFKGSKQGFTTEVDLSELTSFQQDVLNACKEIPFGAVRTYGDLAKAVGKPKAVQAVGGVMARNPIPLIIPCHRVIAASGGMQGYSAAGGIKTKQFLLAHEGITFV
jgi:methylated-DNA-[protein]-cysteine S-methyltransferase